MATSPAATKLPNNVINLAEYEEKWGDTFVIGNSLIGGDDYFIGAHGANGGYTGIGDSESMFGSGKGGNDRFAGGNYAGTSSDDYLESFLFGGQGSIQESSGGGSGPVLFVGDSEYMAEMASGGNDTMTGGINSGNVFIGDALEVQMASARGGNDSLKGGNALGQDGYGSGSNDLVGDSIVMDGNAVGGLDTLIGGNATGAYGGGAVIYNMMVGDGGLMLGHSVGAVDRLTGGHTVASTDGYAAAFNIMIGDGYIMDDDSRGANDILAGGNVNVSWTSSGDGADGYAINVAAGDAYGMFDDAVAGNDTLTGGLLTLSGSSIGSGDGYAVVMNVFAGDTFYLEDAASLGNDKLTGTSVAAGVDGYAFNLLAGDSMDEGFITSLGDLSEFGSFADLLSAPGSFTDEPSSGDSDMLQFGNDTLIGGNGQALNMLLGDGYSMGSYDIGGNDRIQAGSGLALNLLIGDAFMAYGTEGGNDTLIGSTGNDMMYGDFVSGDGDGGADRFVFAPGNGSDIIYDFEAGVDKIDLVALKANPQLRSWAALSASGRIDDDGSNVVVLHLDTFASSSNNTVTIIGIENASELMGSFIYGV